MEAHDDRGADRPGSVARRLLAELAEAVAGLLPARLRLLQKNLEGRMLADDLKRAIEASGRTSYDIGKAAGIRPEIVARFRSGEREDIRLGTASKIAEVLGLALRPIAEAVVSDAKKKPAGKQKPKN